MWKFVTLILILGSSKIITAQSHNHEHTHEDFHIGFGITESYSTSHNEFKPGIHLHLIKNIGHSDKWKIGLGYEYLKGEEKHNSFYLPVGLQVSERFVFSLAPGIVFTKHSGVSESLLSGHVEGMYEFELGKMHLGPLLGLGFNKHEIHIGLGLHAGIGF